MEYLYRGKIRLFSTGVLAALLLTALLFNTGCGCKLKFKSPTEAGIQKSF